MTNIRPTRRQQALTAAVDAFWREVAKAFPEVEGGDMMPAVQNGFESAARGAINHWIEMNVEEK